VAGTYGRKTRTRPVLITLGIGLAGVGAPWTVWWCGALAVLHLALLAHLVHRSTTARRDARRDGRPHLLAGESGVLSWALGIPLITVGALLTTSTSSRTPGLLMLAVGLAVLLGAFAAFIVVNFAPGATPEPAAHPTPPGR
jgi:hypothetical protein